MSVFTSCWPSDEDEEKEAEAEMAKKMAAIERNASSMKYSFRTTDDLDMTRGTLRKLPVYDFSGSQFSRFWPSEEETEREIKALQAQAQAEATATEMAAIQRMAAKIEGQPKDYRSKTKGLEISRGLRGMPLNPGPTYWPPSARNSRSVSPEKRSWTARAVSGSTEGDGDHHLKGRKESDGKGKQKQVRKRAKTTERVMQLNQELLQQLKIKEKESLVQVLMDEKDADCGDCGDCEGCEGVSKTTEKGKEKQKGVISPVQERGRSFKMVDMEEEREAYERATRGSERDQAYDDEVCAAYGEMNRMWLPHLEEEMGIEGAVTFLGRVFMSRGMLMGLMRVREEMEAVKKELQNIDGLIEQHEGRIKEVQAHEVELVEEMIEEWKEAAVEVLELEDSEDEGYC